MGVNWKEQRESRKGRDINSNPEGIPNVHKRCGIEKGYTKRIH